MLFSYDSRPWLKNYDFWVPAQITYPRQPLYRILQIAASQFRDRPATSFFGATLSYGELKHRVDRLASTLAEIGIGKADRVGVMLPNCPQYIIAFFAITRLGAMVVNVNPIYTPVELQAVARDSGMRLLITLDTLAGHATQVQPETGIEQIVVTSLAEYSPEFADPPNIPHTLCFNRLIEQGSGRPPSVEINPDDDIAVLQYTGGTTGIPKGAMLTHFSIFANVIQSAQWGGYFTRRGEERILLVIPMFHIYGQTVGMLLSAWNGSMVILLPKYDIQVLLDTIKEQQPTVFPGVPTIYISLLHHKDAPNCGLDKIRHFGSGSAPLPLEVIEQFEQLSGSAIREGYGLTEASPTTHSNPYLGTRKAGSVGLPVPDTECRIVDPVLGEDDVQPGLEGELVVRGPQIMKGYWNRPDETVATLRDGWLYTGDIARMDEDGYFYIVQRKKDTVIVSGFKVYPTEVEETLFAHPDIQEAAVIGIPDPYRGEAVKAFVVPKSGHDLSAESVISFSKQRLAKFKVPTTVEIVDALPKSAVGKVLRRVLREQEVARMSPEEPCFDSPASLGGAPE